MLGMDDGISDAEQLYPSYPCCGHCDYCDRGHASPCPQGCNDD